MRPPVMMPTTHLPLDRTLDASDRLVVRQAKDWAEVFTDFESANRYALLTPDGALAGMMVERADGAASFFGRWFLKAARPFEMGVYAYESPHFPALWFRRPWTWFLSRIEVADGQGRPLGVIQQRWSWIRRTFDLQAADGRPLARLVGPIWKPWTFVFQAAFGGRELGRIEKRWPGSLGEWVTDADTYLLTPPAGAPALRRLALAAAVLVDFKYFENRK
jgi:hypothetical protein